ncbi:MAG TPA: hypothetical protein VGA55_04925 [Bacteroidota bacterium]
MKNARLFVLSGDADALATTLKTTTGAAEVVIVRVEEKHIARIRETVRLVRAEQASAVAFGCKDLSLQRYQFVLQTFLALSRSDTGFLVDESGRAEEFSPSGYLLIQVPRFIVECAASAWVLLYSFFRLTYLLIVSSRRTR